jgi:hypothetical protein
MIPFSIALVLMAGPLNSPAWYPDGHSQIAVQAVKSLPKELPAFFRSGAATVAHVAQDPDVHKPKGREVLYEREFPEHYLDLELLQGAEIPPKVSEYNKLCAKLGLDPAQVGMLPYAVTEWTERLIVAFAEHRKWPRNPEIQKKALVYAGFLAHYAGDLWQPLHTTVHHNGRAKPDHSSPFTGIHQKVDGIFSVPHANLKLAPYTGKPRVLNPILSAVVTELKASNALVDALYAMESKLPPDPSKAGSQKPTTSRLDPEIAAFFQARGADAVRFLAELYGTAWKLSETEVLPTWLKRN